MCDIYTLQDLVNAADELLKNNNDLDRMKSFYDDYNGNDWNQYVHFDEDKYNRTIVYKSEYIDLYIISWKMNQGSKIHDHSDHGCIVKILRGKLHETLYKNINGKIEFISEKINNQNDISYRKGNMYLHKITALEDSVSIHIYPKNYVMHTYE